MSNPRKIAARDGAALTQVVQAQSQLIKALQAQIQQLTGAQPAGAGQLLASISNGSGDTPIIPTISLEDLSACSHVQVVDDQVVSFWWAFEICPIFPGKNVY